MTTLIKIKSFQSLPEVKNVQGEYKEYLIAGVLKCTEEFENNVYDTFDTAIYYKTFRVDGYEIGRQCIKLTDEDALVFKLKFSSNVISLVLAEEYNDAVIHHFNGTRRVNLRTGKVSPRI